MSSNFRSCPVCQDSAKSSIFSLRGYELVKCVQCRHVYVSNPKEDSTSGFNENFDIHKSKIRHHQIRNLILTLFPRAQVNVVEIGSGYGQLGKLLESDSQIHYQGYEPSQQRAAFSAKHGVNVKNEMFSSSDSNYDVVVIDNVLEHVQEPRELIKVASESLKEGGIVIIIVPNRFDLRRFIPSWKKKHYWLPHCHINYFSYSDLKYLTSVEGLTLKNFDSSTLPSDASVYLKVKTLLDTLGIHVGGLYTYAIKK